MAWGKMASGESIKNEKGLFFDSIDTMRSILTNKRLLILKTVREQSPSSVYELAKMLGRDLKNVNQALKLLSEVGLVTLEKKQTDKRRVIPHVDYSKILLEIPV
jgi:predicted transcriptional regulator